VRATDALAVGLEASLAVASGSLAAIGVLLVAGAASGANGALAIDAGLAPRTVSAGELGAGELGAGGLGAALGRALVGGSVALRVAMLSERVSRITAAKAAGSTSHAPRRRSRGAATRAAGADSAPSRGDTRTPPSPRWAIASLGLGAGAGA
jgi:hypothetical protein